MFIVPVANYSYAKPNNYQTNTNRSHRTKPVSFGTTVVARLNEVPLAEKAQALGLDLMKLEAGKMLPEQLEAQIKPFYDEFYKKVDAIAKTKPLNDTESNQKIHIFTPQNDKIPTIEYDAQRNVLDVLYMFRSGSLGDNLLFHFVGDKLVHVGRSCTDNYADILLGSNHPSVSKRIVEFVQENGHYKVFNNMPF